MLAAALATVLVAGCAPERGGPRGGPPDEPVDGFRPVRVAGVEPCSSLVRTAQRAESTPSLPAIRLPCLTERVTVDVATLGGRPTLINFWATWCGPCRKEMPALQAAYQEADHQIQFVGVDTKDDPSGAAEFLDEAGVTYPQLLDARAELFAHTRVPGLPFTLLLDEDGEEIARHIGPLTNEDVSRLLEKASAASE